MYADPDEPQLEKINEIKEFLTLTSQNAESFYDISQPQGRDNNPDLGSKSKSISDFTVVRGLGKGAFGQVFLVKDKSRSKQRPMQTTATR